MHYKQAVYAVRATCT